MNPRYRLLKQIREKHGQAVWLAKDLSADRQVVCSFVHSDFLPRDLSQQALKERLSRLRRLRHEGLASILDFGRVSKGDHAECYYLISEYVEAPELAVWQLSQKNSDVRLAENLFAQTVAGIEALQFSGLNLAVVRGENLRVIAGGNGVPQLKIVDYGWQVVGANGAEVRENKSIVRSLTEIFRKTARYQGPQPDFGVETDSLEVLLEGLEKRGIKTVRFKQLTDNFEQIKFESRERFAENLQEQLLTMLTQRDRKFVPLVCLSGEFGVGKTRLLEEVGSWCKLQGVHVMTLPTGGIAAGLIALYELLTKKDFLPSQHGIATMLAKALGRHMNKQPILLFYDDLQDAVDSDIDLVLELVRSLTTETQQLRIVVVAAVDLTVNTKAKPDRWQVIAPVGYRPQLEIAVPRLTSDDVLQLGDVRQPLPEAHGNPLMLFELLRRPAGFGRELPKIEEILARRLLGLNASQRSLSEKVATLFMPMDIAWLRGSDWLSAAEKQELDELVRLGVFSDYEGRLSLSYGFFRSRLLSDQQREHRTRLVETLEPTHPESLLQQVELASQDSDVAFDLQPALAAAAAYEKASDLLHARLIYAQLAKCARLRLVVKDVESSVVAKELLAYTQLAERLLYLSDLEAVRWLIESLLSVFDSKGITSRNIAGLSADGEYTAAYLALLEQAVRYYRFTGNFSAARRFIDLGLSLSKQGKSLAAYAKFASAAAILLVQTGEFAACERLVDEVLMRPELDGQLQAQLLTRKGHCRRADNDYRQAQLAYERALKLATESDYLNGMANIRQSMAIIAQLQGEYDAANAELKIATELFRRAGNDLGGWSCRHSIAQINFATGALGAAFREFTACLVYYRSIKHKRMLCETLLEMSRLQLFIGHSREGMDNLRQTLWLSEEYAFHSLKNQARLDLIREEIRARNLADSRLHLDVVMKEQTADTKPERAQALFYAALLGYLEHQSHSGLDEAFTLCRASNNSADAVLFLECAGTGVSGNPFQTRDETSLLRLSAREKVELSYADALLAKTMAKKGARAAAEQLKKGVVGLAKTLPPLMRRTFLSRWALLSTHAVEGPTIEPPDLNSQLVELQNRLITWLERLNSTVKGQELLDVTVDALLDLAAAQKAVCLLRPISAGAEDSTNIEVSPSRHIPSAYGVIGKRRSGLSISARRDPQVLEVHKRFAAGALGAGFHEYRMHQGARLLDICLPIHFGRTEAGFCYVEIESLSQPLEILHGQLIILCHHIAMQWQRLEARQQELSLRPAKMTKDQHAPRGLICASSAMQSVAQQLKSLAGSVTNVVIVGEAGTGKELIARALHETGKNAQGPWVAVDCGTISEGLFEAQFFGYKKGAFTGAHEDKQGFFQEANNGTLFLDNIGALSLLNQAKLLRVLQEQEVRRMGAVVVEKISARLITSTSRDLLELVQETSFRLDLYYRLEVVKIEVPPLRDRQEDISLLIEAAVHQLAPRYNADFKLYFDAEASKALVQYAWPGNVRELFNEIERLLLNSRVKQAGGRVLLSDLSSAVTSVIALTGAKSKRIRTRGAKTGITGAMRDMERTLIESALQKHRGVIMRAAQELRINAFNLRRRMKRLGIVAR